MNGLGSRHDTCSTISDDAAMSTTLGAASCRWATPTLFLPAPFWFDAERCPWTCMRDATLRVLSTTDPCATCPRWELRPSTVREEELVRQRAGTISQSSTLTMMDWFGAFPPPHETE